MAPTVSQAARCGAQTANMTPQEADRFAKYFADPTFCKLFEEFAKDMADPQAKAEQDAFIAQLEAQGELEGIYGKGVQAVHAEPGVVVKTKTANGCMRVYINLCTSPTVEEMKLETVAGDRPGANMTLPHMISCSADRQGTSAKGEPFKAWDFIVHPRTLATCAAKPALLHNLVTMALERMEEAAHMLLLRKYKFVAVKYKGVNGEQRPPALLSRTAGQGEVVDGRLRPVGHPSMSGTPTAAAATQPGAAATEPAAGDTASCKDGMQHTRGSRSSFAFPTSKSSNRHDGIKACATAPLPAEGGVCTPQYQVVERARVDLTAAWSDVGRGLQANSNTPEALVVRVQLPGISSAAGVELDLAADSVTLQVPGKYKLHLPLKHKVDTQRATAKFLTSKQQMVLTLPVVPPPAAEQPTQQPEQPEGQQLVKEVQLVQELQQPDTTDTQVQQQQLQQHQPCGDDSAESSSSSSSSSSSKGDEGATDPTEPAAVVPEAPSSSSKTANQLKWEELHSQAGTEQGSGVECAAHAVVEQPEAQQQPVQAQQQEQQPQQPPVRRASALQPRLSSRRVCAADFV